MLSITNLNQLLAKQYILKCFIDLEYVSAAPQNLYKTLQACYQESFNPTDRLVFYTSEPITDTLLKHLYQAANLIDISNFFVLICSPDNIKQQLLDAANLYSTDQVPFNTMQISFKQTNKLQDKYVVPDTICPIPWMHLEVSPQGDIRPCCVYNSKLDNVQHSSLVDTFNGYQMFALRQQLLNGDKPDGCNNCWERENKGLISNRTYHTKLLKKQLMTTSLETPKITSLDLKPGNTCNFKCRICGPDSSSMYAQEVRKVTDQISIRTYNWAESDSKVIDEIFNLLPTLENIDMYGGEPFLIKPLLKIIKQAVDLGYAKNIRLHYNSNGSIYPEEHVKYWREFKHVDIHFSIDNVGNRFELERGGSWSDVESNIKKLLLCKPANVNVGLMPAISIMNVLYLDELLRWAKELDLPVNPLYVTSPVEFNLNQLTLSAKQLIVNKFKDCSWPEMKNILGVIQSLPVSDGDKFRAKTQYFDTVRQENFSNSHPEIAKAMGYVYNKPA